MARRAEEGGVLKNSMHVGKEAGKGKEQNSAKRNEATGKEEAALRDRKKTLNLMHNSEKHAGHEVKLCFWFCV